MDFPTILIILVVIFLVVGLLKKLLWLCIVAALIGSGIMLVQPETMEEISEVVSSWLGGSIDPLKDNDYSDLIDADTATTPNKTYGELGEDDGT